MHPRFSPFRPPVRSPWFAWLALALLAAGLNGCHTAEPTFMPSNVRFFLEANPDDEAVTVTLPRSGTNLRINPKFVAGEFDLLNVEIAQVELGRCLLFQLTPVAARDLYRATAVAQGRRLVLAVDGRMLGARVLDQPMANGTILIFVELPDAELPALVQKLKRTVLDYQQHRTTQK